MLGRPVSITDARGRRVPLYDEGQQRPADPRHPASVVRRAEDHSVTRKLSRGEVAAVLGGGLFHLAVIVALSRISPPPPGWITGLGYFPLILASGFLYRRASRRAQADRLRAALLAARLCASCGYDLSGSAAGGDGVTACAECGAAWRV